MNDCDKVFVYGTLKPGHERWPTLQPYAVKVEPAVVAGFLIDMGAFPAATFGPSGVNEIHGYLVTIQDSRTMKELLTILDAIEGVSSNLYERVMVHTWPIAVWEGDGAGAWSYQVCKVEGGCWRPRLDEKVEA